MKRVACRRARFRMRRGPLLPPPQPPRPVWRSPRFVACKAPLGVSRGRSRVIEDERVEGPEVGRAIRARRPAAGVCLGGARSVRPTCAGGKNPKLALPQKRRMFGIIHDDFSRNHL